ncbi:hypothetical protein HOLleu_26606 [Holothuria leucospilota]|uniref:Integrase catalytic domain-containing protein n=1 Tax=Holothuria leucospilota TaxID=206669 RepID=A0A9Q1BP44_HOLLE|nr:hypothetical protein HOLleu_26606 [Holothuria leucospilota]
MENTYDNFLRKIYYDLAHPAGFGGVKKLYDAVKRDGRYNITRRAIQEWLKRQNTYTLHKSVRKKFPRNRVLVNAIDHQWEMDLADLSSLSRYNKGYKFLLTCIDVLSKFAWVIPLKNKTGRTLLQAVKTILSSGRKPDQIHTDRGTEFVNKLLQNYLKDEGIHFFTTNNETKASVVERFNRTLKSKMWKYFTYRNTLKYVDILPDLVKGYNHSYHRSIKMRPVEVTKDNENRVWRTLYPSITKTTNFKFNVGDKVRISKSKLKFENGHMPNWSEEIFTIVKRKNKPVPVYKLIDWGGEPIEEYQRVGDSHVPLLRVVRIGTMPPTQTSIVKGNWIQYHPLTNITDTGPIQFTVQGSIDDYIDLSQTVLHVRAKIVQAYGDDLENDANVGLANLMLQTLFSEVDVSLNDRLVTPSTNTYPYRAILETLLSYGPDAKESQLTGNLFYKDTAGKMDSCNPSAAADVVNLGLKARSQYTRNSNTVDLIGPIHCDSFFQEKILLGGVELKLKLHRSKNEFCLLSSQAGADFKVRIVEASIFMRHVKVHPQVALGHAKALERGTAKYPNLPKRLVIGCVDSEAFNGSYNRNPFNFHHHNLNFIALHVDGEQLPWKLLRPNFGDNHYIMAYQTLFSGLNTMFSDKGNHIDRYDYGHGYTLYAFDMTPDLANGGHFHLRKNGNVRLEMQFDRALVRTVNVIVYAEYDAIVEIDKTRVFPSDCLPRERFLFPRAFIANTDEADKPGSHWVAVYFEDNGVDFFDSFGRTPEECSPYFEHFLKKHCNNIIRWNQKRLQRFLSTVCGQYCLFFLLNRCRNLSMNTIISKFTEDPTFNDSLVNDFITKRYNLDLTVRDDEYVVLQIARKISDKYY